MSEKLGVEKVQAIVESVKELVIAAKTIKADGKIDLADLSVVIALIPKLPKHIENFKAVAEAFEQIKDVDVSEVIALIQAVNNAVKEIEKA